MEPGHRSKHCPIIICTAHTLAQFQPTPNNTLQTASRHGPRIAQGRDYSQQKAWMQLQLTEKQWGWESSWVTSPQRQKLLSGPFV